MAEVVGLVASVVQLAGAGLKLSQTLYQYADGVASADRRIKDIANEVKLTSFVIQELGAIFERDETANLISENAVRTANETIKECFAVFTELELKINKGKPGKMGRLMLPFKDNKIELLRSQIDKLKSTLELLMQVLIHAHQVSSEKYNREAEAKHREEIKQLLENKKQATKKYEESLRNFSVSDGSTIVDDGDRSLRDKDDIDPSSDLFNTAGAIGSTINPDTLATCVDHVRSLLADIETLQLALAEQVDGDDHSDHHQKAIGSYFLARSHLDSVLLGKSQANVTDTQIQQSLSKTSTHSSVSVSTAGYIPPLGRRRSADSRDERAEEKKRYAEEKAKKAETKKLKQEEMRLRKLEREAEEAEAARAAETLEQKAEREAKDKALFAGLKKNTMFGQSQQIAPAIPELDGSYRASMVSGITKGKKGRIEVVSASLPEPRRTSSKVNTALQESSDNGLEIEGPERITARRRRLQFSEVNSRIDDMQKSRSPATLAKLKAPDTGDKRLWQVGLRRRVEVGDSTKASAESRRGSYQSQSLQQRLSEPSSSVRRPTVTPESTGRRSTSSAKFYRVEPRVPGRRRTGSQEMQYLPRIESSQYSVTGQSEERTKAEKRESMQRIASTGLGAAEIGYRRLPPSSSPRHRSPRSRSHSPRDHRYHDSDSSGYVSYSEKFEREQESDRIKKLEEQSRRDWEVKPKKKRAERERQKERRAPVAHTSQPKQPLSAFERHFERQRQESSEEEYTSPSIQEGTSECEGDGGSWDYIEEIEDVSRADEVDELLREWTTLLG